MAYLLSCRVAHVVSNGIHAPHLMHMLGGKLSPCICVEVIEQGGKLFPNCVHMYTCPVRYLDYLLYLLPSHSANCPPVPSFPEAQVKKNPDTECPARPPLFFALITYACHQASRYIDFFPPYLSDWCVWLASHLFNEPLDYRES